MLRFPFRCARALLLALLLGLVERLAGAAASPTWASADDYARDATTTLAILRDTLAPGGAADALEVAGKNREKMAADLAAVEAVDARPATGADVTEDDIAALRRGVQRIPCVCSPLAPVLCDAL